MRTTSIFLLFTVALSLFACNEEYPELEDGMYAEFNTSMGPIVAELYFEETPMTVASFVSLTEGTSKMADSTYKGKKYYDGLIFPPYDRRIYDPGWRSNRNRKWWSRVTNIQMNS